MALDGGAMSARSPAVRRGFADVPAELGTVPAEAAVVRPGFVVALVGFDAVRPGFVVASAGFEAVRPELDVVLPELDAVPPELDAVRPEFADTRPAFGVVPAAVSRVARWMVGAE
ncbi:hypothetical protein [Streptomyces sp. SP17KL33]|uniref:hypothetical protein n=1 Tax=Streptomyces sp. SP17KL33 TaxID=3002534 RepID=UPI002E760238|nr:hypothetical protein [Streptomyces sp. SP17KL33]MEE1833098.1 hypothetical protein [Streptomyces sp. SP17KL33]